jgi:protein TonB
VKKILDMLRDKDRRRGLIATVMIHLLLLIALFFLALSTPLPLPGEEGVEVNLGYDEQGYGDVQEESAPPESQPTPPPQQMEQLQPEQEEIIEPEPELIEPEPQAAEEDMLTQDVEEAPALDEKKEDIEEETEPVEKEPEKEVEKKPEPVKEIVEDKPEEKPVDSTYISESEEETEAVVEEPKPTVNQRALYPGTSTNKEGSNQGNTQGPGDMGKPTGYKESEGYDGKGGIGNGISFGLQGRGSMLLEAPSKDFEEVGDVTVTIWVNREGKVIKAEIDRSKTEFYNELQWKQAKDAALNSKFEAKQDAPEEQRGWITYTYIK